VNDSAGGLRTVCHRRQHPRDIFVAGASRDVEVWLGFELHGRAARLTT
jgi:hypothetical protein